MSEKRYREDLEGTRAPMPAPPVPGRMPASAKIFPGAMLMRKQRDASGVAAGAEDAVARASSSSGAALPAPVKERFESSLGADLSSVRVHTGADSAAAASSVGARAYTIGNDIHFADGQFAPSDPFGLHLLAHEVAHTQQQAGGTPTRQHKLAVSSTGDAAEVEADRAADAMVAGARAAVGRAGGVQRKEEGEHEGNVEKGGDYTVYGVAGENTYSAKLDKDGHLSAFGKDMELLPPKTFGPHQICGTPPLFASLTLGAKAGGALGKDKKPGETFTTSIVGEVTGAILMGAAKEGLGKAGIEGTITGSLSGEGHARVTDSGFEVEAIDIVVRCEVAVALVGEVGEGHKKVGGGIKRNLGALKVGTLHWDGKHATFEHCSIAEVGQFATEVLKNSADTLADTSVVGIGAKKVMQAYEDHKAREEFDKNTEQMAKEDEQDLSARIGRDQNDAANARMQQRMDATAGMTRNDDGSYSRDLTDEELQQKIAEMKTAIAARGPQAEAEIAKARADAQQAMATCNRLTGGGSWDAVKPAAKKPYSDGFQAFASGQACEQQAKEYAAANDKRVLRYFDVAQAARRTYDEAAESFRAGDAAQG